MRLSLLLIAIAPAWGQTAPVSPDVRTRVDAVFERFHRTDSPGCTVGVSSNNQPVLSVAYGMADLEHDVPLTPESIFEPGSVTKQFTAAAVLILAQQGKLSLEDPVRKYI